MRSAVLQRHRFVAWLAAASCFMGACLAACPIFLPLFAFDELGFTATTSGLCVALTGLMGVIARFAWGRVSEQRGHRVHSDLGLIAAGSAGAVLLVMVAPRVGSWSLWLGVLAFGGIASGWNVIAAVTTIRDLPAALGSAGTSLIQTAFFAGLLAGPLLFAAVLEESGGYQWAWLTIAGTCALAGATMLAWGGGRHMAAIT
jgi:MFS family permease